MANNCSIQIAQKLSSRPSPSPGHPHTVEQRETNPPDGGYGWVCVASNFLIYAHSWGISSSFAVYLAYYLSHHTFADTSSLDYAFVGGLSVSQSLFIAPVATRIIRLFGTKTCLHIGIFFETLSLIGASFATQKWHIFLSQGVCFGWGTGFLFVGSVGIIPQWFVKRRSLANAVAAAGTGFGGLVYSLATQRMIDTIGLPWTFRTVGLVTFAVNLAAANLLRDRNHQIGSRVRAFDLGIFKRPEFILLQGWSYCTIFGYVVLLFTLPSYAQGIGLSSKQGSIVGAVFNLGQMLGRPLVGLASDRWGRLNVATLATFLSAVSCFVFWLPAEVTSNKMAYICAFGIIGGSIAGTFWGAIAPIGVEVVGIQNLPSALSWTWVLLTIPTTFAEAITLKIQKPGALHWGYIGPELFTALMYIGAAVCILFLRAWKIGEMEEIEHLQLVVQIGQLENSAPRPRPTIEINKTACWNIRDGLRRIMARRIV